jgi:hypothetical protein
MDISAQGFSLLPVEFPTTFLGSISAIQKCLSLSKVYYFVVVITTSHVKRMATVEGITGKCVGGGSVMAQR